MSSSHSLSEALNLYLADLQARQCSQVHIRSVASRLGHFVTGREGRSLSAVTRSELSAFLVEMAETRADGTMAGITASHRAFWKFCVAEGWLDFSPADRLRSYSYEPRVRRAAHPEDVVKVAARLLDFAHHRGGRARDIRDALFVSLSLDCGGRRNAMLKLRRPWVGDALHRPRTARNGRIYYEITARRDKWSSSNLVFFEETAELFRLWLPLVPPAAKDWIFVNLSTGGLLKPDSVTKACVRVCEWVGVPIFRTHAVRKRNVSDIRASKDISTAQHYAGHKSPETTRRHYVDFFADEVGEAAADLATRRRGEQPNTKQEFDEHMANLFGLDGSAEKGT
jgi:integrase